MNIDKEEIIEDYKPIEWRSVKKSKEAEEGEDDDTMTIKSVNGNRLSFKTLRRSN